MRTSEKQNNTTLETSKGHDTIIAQGLDGVWGLWFSNNIGSIHCVEQFAFAYERTEREALEAESFLHPVNATGVPA